MRRSIFNARPARSLTQVLSQQHRRAFSTPPIKGTATPAPVELSKEQAHPIGAFYEAILNTPQIPEVKPEAPPATSAAPVEPVAPVAPAAPVAPVKPAAAAPEPKQKEREPAAPQQKRGRRPREPKDDKSKSVAPDPTPDPAPTPAPAPAPSSASEVPGSNDNDVQARARVVFGSRLVGPAERAERLAAIRTKSRRIAGVLVPPKPEEPDNCCMSGCVNCVWDLYRDDMEDWASAHGEAEKRLRAQEAGIGTTSAGMAAEPKATDLGAVSMDDDGGGSIGNWKVGSGPPPSAKPSTGFWDEELYKNIPVGIREFMKQEKRLKEKHLRDGTVGG
jgi:outer membrane biosynthesis protein TonB